MLNVTKGALIEYGLSVPPLALVFEFNPQQITRSRSITLPSGGAPGRRKSYDFVSPTETPRVAQGVEIKPETLSVKILVSAADRMGEDDPIAKIVGIEPELDTLRSMIEPKEQGPGGMQTLASLGQGGDRAFQRSASASVLLFVWGTHVLPVFLTSVQVEEKDYLPSLVPYRAEVTLALQVIESDNPFFTVEKLRQVVSAGLNTAHTVSAVLGGIF